MQDGAGDDSDFLSRERAALGADADQFAQTGNVLSVTVQGGDDDLLGGGDQMDGDSINQFQSSFPAVDTRNEVSMPTVLV